MTTPIRVPRLKDVERIEYSKEALKLKRENPVLYYHTYPLEWVSDALYVNVNSWKYDYPPPDWNKENRLPIWSKQREILESLIKYKKVAVKSGHGVGKTFISSIAALMILFVYKAVVITTAPTDRQVKALLWGEIRRNYQYADAKLRQQGLSLGGDLQKQNLILGPKWYASGFAVKPEQGGKETQHFQGFHAETICLIVDEACGVDRSIFEAAQGILTSDNSFVLLIGNPLDSTSYFADCFLPTSKYHQITISCADSPNVRHKELIYPELISYEKFEEAKDPITGYGFPSPAFDAHILGEFPKEGTNTLIPLSKLEEAKIRDYEEDTVHSIALDVAADGDDRTVVSVRWKSGKAKIVDVASKLLIPETTELAKKWYSYFAVNEFNKKIAELEEKMRFGRIEHAKYQALRDNIVTKYGSGRKLPNDVLIVIDDIGLGKGVHDELLLENYPVYAFTGSETAYDNEKFFNRRAEGYWKLREAFIEGSISLDDEEALKELSKIQLDFSRVECIKIKSKREIKKVLGKSPDFADSIMMLFSDATAPSISTFTLAPISKVIIPSIETMYGSLNNKDWPPKEDYWPDEDDFE